jgi:hypothetical protein
MSRMIDAPSKHEYAWMNSIAPQITEHTMLQSVVVYLRLVIEYYLASAYKLAKTLTEIHNIFMHLKCWALDSENYLQTYRYLKWYILCVRNKYQKNWGNSSTIPLVPKKLRYKNSHLVWVDIPYQLQECLCSLGLYRNVSCLACSWHHLWPTNGILTRALHINCRLGSKGLTMVTVWQNFFEINSEYWSQVEGPGMAWPITILSPNFSCKTSGRYYPSMTNNTESPHWINSGVLFLKITACSDMTHTAALFLIIN